MEQGIYEQIINRKIEDELREYRNLKDILIRTEKIDKAEASLILAKYLGKVVEQGLNALKEQKVEGKILLVNRLIDVLRIETEDEFFEGTKVSNLMEILYLLLDTKNTVLAFHPGEKKVEKILPRPTSSLAISSLFTGSEGEPKLGEELKREFATADQVDMLVSFLKWSGVRILERALWDFGKRGGELRIITTSYMSATDLKAVEELYKIPGAKIKVSYDTKHTRHHAKAYVFHRKTGFSTAYIGSSNLSKAALNEGLEWNIKITEEDMPEMMEKVEATFEGYWNSENFKLYRKEDHSLLKRALEKERGKDSSENPYIFDIEPYPFQKEILDRLEAERTLHGRYKNLVVAATGTGKTVISALDYRRVKRREKGTCPLLFIAHRQEILKQSLETFRGVLKDPNFGDLYVGNYKPDSLDHLFISIQTLQSSKFLERVDPDFYDFIVIDEFHHAAAKSYQGALNYFKPKILLGLTATPERMDGKSVLTYFDDRIAGEIRLPEAIQKNLLSTFHYFGVTDTVDLRDLPWRRGGYDVKALEERYVGNSREALKRGEVILKALHHYVTDLQEVRGLGFCVSVEHAKFMSAFFHERGIPSMALTGESSQEERDQGKIRLNEGKLNFLFVVDLYNEGVDIPEVNTILFLRPTESLTVFLQQLGRGLRLSEGKECLTVLDFIGQAHKKYNFATKFQALFTKTNQSLEREIKNGFSALPPGCYIQLERQAEEYVLENIRKNLSRARILREKIESFEEDTGKTLNFQNFLDHYQLTPRHIYDGKRSFATLCAEAGVTGDFEEPMKDRFLKAFPRLQSMDAYGLLDFYLKKVRGLNPFRPSDFSPREKRMLNMLYTSILGTTIKDWKSPEVKRNIEDLVGENPRMIEELQDLFQYNLEHLDLVDRECTSHPDFPITLHSHYTRDQLLVGMDYLTPDSFREGVRFLEELNTFVLLVTLHKSEKDYSPTTMYKDYVVSDRLFHWQSQNQTSEASETGQRLIHHEKRGIKVLLFVRDYKRDPLSKTTAPYTFLGPVTYVKHEGERPLNILWRLEEAIPGKYMNQFAIVG